MLKEGLVYFVLLTGVNILNLVMFRVSSIAAQSSAACLGQAVTMIMSQRIILGLHDWRTTLQGPTSQHGRQDYELSGSKSGMRPSNVHVLGRSTGGPGVTSIGVHTSTVVSVASPHVLPYSAPNAYSPNAYSPNSADPLKYGHAQRMSVGGNDADPASVVHVRVDEEIKEDYDSVYAPAGNSTHYNGDSVSHNPLSPTLPCRLFADMFPSF